MLTSLSSVQWLIALLVFSMTTLGLIVIPQMMVARLKESLVLLEKRTLRLKRANEVLRRQIRTRREAERALRESEERFRTVYQAIPDPVTLIRLDDERCVDVNDEFLRLTGWGKEEVVGKTAADLSIWCDPKNRAKMIEEIHRSGRAENVQAQFRMKDGGIIIGLFSAMSLMIGGKPHLISITRDITERYRAEKALKESEEKYRLVVDNANEGIILTQGGKVVFTNGRAITRSGYSVDELYRTDLAEFLHPEDREAAINRYLSIMAGKESKGSHEYRIMDKWGKTRWVRSHSVRVNWLGEPALITFMNEITQQKEMEAEREKLQARLQRAEKMEAIGTLAGGVAHDLNNVLSGIVSYPDLLLMQLPEESPLRKSIVTMRESGKRAAAIVQDLLTLARRGVATTELVNLNAVIRDYLQSPEHERLHALHPHVQVESLLDHHLLNVVGSPLHLQKTVMNLVSNALEAMPQGGTVLISTENRYMDRPLNAYDHVRRGDYVVMTVSDTGIGILPQDRERIFEPFYTKKAMGRSGTGLGMAVVWGTVKDHGAKIDVESVEGKGTTFTLYFPATRKEMVAENPFVSPDAYQGKGESVLVVDDMEDQRDIASTLLAQLGYSVRAVSTGEEALAHVQNEAVDLLVLDMIMGPGMDGLDTYREILKIRPNQKAVLASGYSETDRVKEAQRLGAGTYIRKPYTLKTIGLALRKELNGEVWPARIINRPA
jgi:two-component system cell cycle sensor histidine kinase/response regulator CckA